MTAPEAQLRIERLRLTNAEVRFQLEARATDPAGADRHVGFALLDLSLSDDAGRAYRLYWEHGRGNREFWTGEVLGLPAPPADVNWLELAAVGSATRHRIDARATPPAEVGPAEPAWPTPAEAYLALIRAAEPPMAFSDTRARAVTAAVAEAMLSVGAIPPDSPLLPEILGRAKRSAHSVLPAAWPAPARRPTASGRQIPVYARLPFSRAAVVIESLCTWGEDTWLHVYGWPWLRAERWPVVVPALSLRAIDDRGGEHEGRLCNWTEHGSGESTGDFVLCPAVPRDARKLRVVITALAEAAWADIDLPAAGDGAD